jgi:type I restriction enzyme S subunit
MKKGWVEKYIEDCFRLKSGDNLTTKAMSADGKYPVFGGNGIMGYHNTYNTSGSKLIVGRVGALCGNVRHVKENIWLTDNAFKIVDFKYDFDHSFLTYLLNFHDLRQYARQSAQPVISNSSLKGVVIRFPISIEEQQRIVSILDECFAAIDKAKSNAEKNLMNAKELFESYLQGVFESGKNWKRYKLGDVCGFVRGPFGGSLKKNIFKSEGFAVYEQQHAIYDQFDKIRYYIDEKKFLEMKRFELKPGDLIMSCSGTMGKIAIVPNNVKRGIINQALLKLSPSKMVDNLFLKTWMQSESFQNSLKEFAGGAAIQNVASVAVLKKIEIQLPDINEQKVIVERVQTFLYQTQKLEAVYQKKIEDLEELKRSILQRAFAGELRTGELTNSVS